MAPTKDAGSTLAQIDPLCERFESELDAGRAPSIEQYVESAEPALRAALLQELIALEVDSARRNGAAPSIEDYLTRFPSDSTRVRSAFGAATREVPSGALFLEEGSDLGPYRIVREIGRGGMGVVYEARHDQLDRVVALKLLPHHALLHEQAEERFQREARAIAKLHHGSIVPIFDYGQLEGMHYFAMQLIEGESLGDAILRRRDRGANALEPGALAVTVRQIVQIARALQFAHNQGVVHRDVKPSNVLIDNLGAAWLVDFGVAHTQESDLTTQDDLLGTIRYMPPERFEGQTAVTDDVYSLGMTLFEALTLRPVFEETDPVRLMRVIVERRTPALRSLLPNAPRDLDTVLAKATAHRAEDRYASPGEFADDLVRFLDDVPVAARRARMVERTWRWAKRNHAASIAIIALTLLALGGSGLSVLLSHRNAKITQLSENASELLDKSEKARRSLRFEVYRSDMRLGALAVFRNRGATLSSMLERWEPKAQEQDLRGWEWHVLRSTVARPRDCMAFDAGAGNTIDAGHGVLAVAGKGMGVLLNGETSEREGNFRGLAHPIGVRIRSDARFLVESEAFVYRVIAMPSGEEVARRPSESVVTAEWIAGTAKVLIMEPDPALWDFRSGSVEPIEFLEGLESGSTASDDGRLVAATDGGSIVRVVDLESDQLIRSIDLGALGEPSYFEWLAINPTGTMVAVGNRLESIYVWSVKSGDLVARFSKCHLAPLNSMRWSNSGTKLVTTSQDSTVKVWDIEAKRCERVLRGHNGYALDACFTPGDQQIVSTGTASTVRFWDQAAPPGHIYIKGGLPREAPVYRQLDWSRDGTELRIAGYRRTRTWDMEGPVPRMLKQRPYVFSVPSPNGRLEFRATEQSAEIVDLETGEDLLARKDQSHLKLGLDKWMIDSISWSPDSERIYVSDRSEGLVFSDLWGDLRVDPILPGLEFSELKASPCGRYLVIEIETAYHVVDLRSKEIVATIQSSDIGRMGVDDPLIRFSPAGDVVALAAGPEVYLVDTATWTRKRTLDGVSGTIRSMAWSPDGSRIAVGGATGVVSLLEPSAGLVVAFGVDSPVFDLAWNPDGTRLAGLDEKDGWHLWDATASMEDE